MRSNKERSLVIGGTGFIGKAIANKLREKGKDFFYTRRGGSEFDSQSLNSDLIGNWRSLVEELDIKDIYIAAGHYESLDDPTAWGKLWEANYSFPRSILDQLWELEVRVIVLGSYLQKDPETHGLWSFYTWSKESFRRYIEARSNSALAQITYVYLYDTYGNGDNRPKILNLLMNYEIEKGLLNCGNKNQRLNLTHVDDVVDGLMHAIRVVTTENYREYQISAPDSLTLEELVKMIEKYRDCNIPVAYGKLQNRRQILNLWQCAKAVPNFMPRRTLSEFLTLARLIEKY